MVDPALFPDAVISCVAAIGLLIVRSQIVPRPEGLAWRFRLILLISAVFYFVRTADWVFDAGVYRALTIIAAAAIPCAALLLAEGMVRRHAPWPVKLLAVVGLGVFALAALIVPLTRTPGFLGAFLVYQIVLLVASFWLVLSRDRSGLSDPENRLAQRVVWVGPFVLLLLASDYRLWVFFDPPALSGLAALMVAWVASTSEARAATGAFIGQALLVLAAVSGLAAWALGAQHGWRGAEVFEAATMLAAILLAFMVWLSSAALRRARSRASLETALGTTENLPDYLRAITRHGLTDGFVLLQAEDLADYDADLLVRAAGVRGALSRNDLPVDSSGDSRAESQVRALLDRFAARDLFLVSREPIQMAVGTPMGLGDDTGADIRAAFAIARLIAERDARQEQPV